ncbi:hypothetical protein XA68_12449 [Ophiocordyceps unilateralis]|uniref:Uncharacterized protein n=1 Tax=Ophiocordyceps unilateralis TaxID=268505 RepID=A0A2A9PES4_OPHUN|nr:hypothetical protein XA68_12449 [Ophiocordyceps unilateralis]
MIHDDVWPELHVEDDELNDGYGPALVLHRNEGSGGTLSFRLRSRRLGCLPASQGASSPADALRCFVSS